MMFEHSFTGKCPSLAQINAQIKQALKQGADWIELHWGENFIVLEYSYANNSWAGNGWIRRNGGSDIAAKLNLTRSDDPRDRIAHPVVAHRFN